jgi:hypothetical protein
MTRSLIATGQYAPGGFNDFANLWHDNTEKYMPSAEKHLITQIVVLGNGGTYPGVFNRVRRYSGVTVNGNLGHVHDLIHGKKPYEFCGWSANVITAAMLAYSDESDLIYKEQDCLAFGPWIEQMYADLGDGKMIFGRKMKGPPWMQCGQSLILIKHDFIPAFVASYLSMGRDGDIHNLPERKFERLEEKFGKGIVKRLSFGYDRERPINFDDPVWYAQKFTAQELDELRKRNLI